MGEVLEPRTSDGDTNLNKDVEINIRESEDAGSDDVEEHSENKDKTKCCGSKLTCCGFDITSWKAFLGIHYISAIMPSVWKASVNGGKVQATYYPDREWFGNAKRVGHSLQGFAAGITFFEIDWDRWVNKCATLCGCGCTDRVKSVVAGALQLVQSAVMIIANLVYPIYNLNKRYKASNDGHYELNGVPTKQVFFDGSFYVNHTDWILGMTFALACVLIGLLGKYFCCKSSAPMNNSTSGCFNAECVRRGVHRPGAILSIIVVMLVSIASIYLGATTMENIATRTTP